MAYGSDSLLASINDLTEYFCIALRTSDRQEVENALAIVLRSDPIRERIKMHLCISDDAAISEDIKTRAVGAVFLRDQPWPL
jgi:hypothetical protein